jgi:hypothetical protein
MFDLNNNPLKASLSHHGAWNVVKACYETCDEPVCFVNVTAVGSDFVITSFSIHPSATAKQAQLAGDVIDAALEVEAHKAGICRLLIVLPKNDTAEVVRTYELQPFTMRPVSQNTNPSQYFN